RGLAEGLTEGVQNYTGFPSRFLFLGQGFWMGALPPQLLILVLAAVAFWLLLERSTIGRGLSAIGYSQDGARHPGMPVGARPSLVYILSGLTASLAAVIYVAHLGQAKSDAGTGYELTAITAVVLGGTSIFGGLGSIRGSLLGLAAIVVLQNGLRLAGGPAELAGVLTGVLLILSVAAVASRKLLAALIGVAALAGTFLFAHAARQPAAHRTVVAMMPKAKGDPYFVSCRQGAEEAAKQLGVELLWDGPTDLDPAKQNEVV